MNSDHQDGSVITVAVGDDLVLAQALAASLEAENIEIELVLSSDPYVGLEHTSPHRLMIHERDVEAAKPIIEAHAPPVDIEASWPARRRGVRDVVGLVLLVMFVGGPVAGVVMIARELFGNF